MGVSLLAFRCAHASKVGVLRATLSLRCYAPPAHPLGKGLSVGEGLRTVLTHALRMPHAENAVSMLNLSIKSLPCKYLKMNSKKGKN
ncbi:MAG: hypothetical protein NZ519_06555 [Bacteroidia bacterium]|nr:hypothetical protein [Bacteroidia bacterium]